MEKQDLDWETLGFAYQPCSYSYTCRYEDGAWGEGSLTTDHTIRVSECANIFHYCQEVFEGLKAYTTEDGRIVCFRPEENAARMVSSATRLVMPPFPKERFVEAVRETVAANASWVPPFGSGAALYVRPFMIGIGETLGVRPSDAYEFRILVTPVGPYFKGGVTPIRLVVSDYDRAAPHGTGAVKAGLNYAMSLWPYEMAHAQGFDEALYLDAATRTYIEETGGANMILVDAEGRLVVPQSKTDSILPSITRRSIIRVASELLGLEVIERPVAYAELGEFAECGLCGTAAVIVPVMSVSDYEGDIVFNGGSDEIGPVLGRLRETLTGIQGGSIEDPFGWVFEICPADGEEA